MLHLLSKELAEKIANHLNGTCGDVEQSIAAFEEELPNRWDPSVFVDEMNERLEEEFEIQLCEECEWWTEMSDLVQDSDSRSYGRCSGCR